ncbi:MAG: hypothetical protein F6K32_08040 [Desertifilum sp. SIO1I2]|nr:hypothetical protein [Desertifilum sp. SIO1I2]
MNQALHTNRNIIVLNDIEWNTEKGIQYFNIEISQVIGLKNKILGLILTFIEIDNSRQLVEQQAVAHVEMDSIIKTLKQTQHKLKKTTKKLESAYQEIEVLHQDISLSNPNNRLSDRP